MTATSANTAGVAIVGGGPVGMMLALFLDRHSVKTVVFNTEQDTRWHPKGSTHNSRTMEHDRRLGISQGIRALGLPAEHQTDVSYCTRYNSRSLFDLFGIGFTLLRLHGASDSGDALQSAAIAMRIPLAVVDVEEDEARQLYGRDLVLTRPDQHVCWRGNHRPGDYLALMRRVTGHGRACLIRHSHLHHPRRHDCLSPAPPQPALPQDLQECPTGSTHPADLREPLPPARKRAPVADR